MFQDDGKYKGNSKKKKSSERKAPLVKGKARPVTESNSLVESDEGLLKNGQLMDEKEDVSQSEDGGQETMIPLTEDSIEGLVTMETTYSHSVDDPYREELASTASDNNNDDDDLELNADDYNIDWSEVEAGKAAGIPGQWETVQPESNKDLSSAIGEDLCDALRIKAAAYSDETWQCYWGSNGPYLLAQQWKILHPDIPLKQVEVISGLGFLCDAMETMMSFGGTCTTVDHTQPDTTVDHTHTDTTVDHTHTDTTVDRPDATVDHTQVATTLDHTHTDNTDTTVDQPDATVDHTQPDATVDHTHTDTTVDHTQQQESSSQSDCSIFNDEQVLLLWNTFYNEMYWSNYSQFMKQSAGTTVTEPIQVEMESAENTEDDTAMVSYTKQTIVFIVVVIAVE